MRKPHQLALTAFLGLAALSGTALAHGFGGRYELSLPGWMFYAGGVGVVVVSFGIVSLFAGTERGRFNYRSKQIEQTQLRLLTSRWIVGTARLVSVGLLFLGLLSGFFGSTDFNQNLLTNLVWVGWWVGYTFTVIFIGNSWPAINPWKTSYEWFTGLLGRDPSLERRYRYGGVPAAVSFVVFAWIEIISPFSESPRWMAGIVLAYSLYVWIGIYVYGVDAWLENADPFTRLYDYLGKFAPVSTENGGELRMYGVGLVPEEDSLYRAGGLVFLVAVLYSVTFDGFLATPEWRSIASSAPELPVQYATSTALMLLGLALFIVVYVLFAWFIKFAAAEPVDALTLAQRFALSLLPIAVGYQVAHFYTFLLTQGQYLALALTDPLGLGWTLPGLAGYEPSAELPFLSNEFVWQSQVALILAGHIVAVWVAHHIALDVYPERRKAIRSQVPMMMLMVGYTILSLWILTRPVIEPVLP